MLIDVHTHLGDFASSLALHFEFERTGEVPAPVAEAYLDAIEGADAAILLAVDGRVAGYYFSNEIVAWMAQRDSRIVGFASVNPSAPDAADALERAVADLRLQGVKLAPMYQFYAPDDPAVFPIYERALALGIPILTHQGTSFLGQRAALDESNPVRLDRVAREFPELKIVIAHLGYPWGGEVVALLRKHPNIYADCSAVTTRTWFLYSTLMHAYEYGVLHKVLLGSDYPAVSTVQARDAVLDLATIAEGTRFPSIPASDLEALVSRDSLAVLGIAHP